MNLRVEDLPLPVDPSLYQEAIVAYLERSYKYIDALYAFGQVRYPGLSDLDLLVVPKDSYLAPLGLHLRGRLPRRFDPIIEHDVFVVPTSQLAACRYRLNSQFCLIYGRNVLSGLTAETSVAAEVSEALEAANDIKRYLAEIRRSGVVKARSGVRVFNSQRYKAARLVQLGLLADDGYGATIDALRDRFMAAPDPACILEMLRAFEQSATACESALRSVCGFEMSAFDRIVGVSNGVAAVPLEGFCAGDAKRRADIIRAYRQELVRRNYWYGFWFVPHFYPAAAATPPWHRLAFRALRSGSRRWGRLRSSLRPVPPFSWV
jgi:hypothetical protein